MTPRATWFAVVAIGVMELLAGCGSVWARRRGMKDDSIAGVRLGFSELSVLGQAGAGGRRLRGPCRVLRQAPGSLSVQCTAPLTANINTDCLAFLQSIEAQGYCTGSGSSSSTAWTVGWAADSLSSST